MFKFLCALWRWLHREWLRADHASNGTVTAVYALNLNLNFLCSFAHSNVRVSELNCSWEVLIQNGDFASSIISWKSVLHSLLGLGGVKKFNPEFKVGVPLFIINNWDLDNFLLFSLSELDLMVDFLVVLGGYGGIIDGSDTYNEFLVHQLLDNGNFNMAITFSDRVM